MRFLVDKNLSPRVCDHLARAGYEAVHVRDAGLRSAPDPQVLARAVADGRILLTADRGDFGRELARTQALAPSVVLLRQLPDVVRAEQVAAVLVANLSPVLVAALDKGAFVVLAANVMRLRYLPLR